MLVTSEIAVVQGRVVTLADLEQIRRLIAAHPGWSRRRLSERLAAKWNWRNPAGQLKDMATRSLLVKLDQRGWIQQLAEAQAQITELRRQLLGPKAEHLSAQQQAQLDQLANDLREEAQMPPPLSQEVLEAERRDQRRRGASAVRPVIPCPPCWKPRR